MKYFLFRGQLRLFLVVLAVIFAAEFPVMLLLPYLVHEMADQSANANPRTVNRVMPILHLTTEMRCANDQRQAV